MLQKTLAVVWYVQRNCPFVPWQITDSSDDEKQKDMAPNGDGTIPATSNDIFVYSPEALFSQWQAHTVGASNTSI